MHKVISQKTSRSRPLIRPSSLVISVPKKTPMILAVEKGNARASNSKKVIICQEGGQTVSISTNILVQGEEGRGSPRVVGERSCYPTT